MTSEQERERIVAWLGATIVEISRHADQLETDGDECHADFIRLFVDILSRNIAAPIQRGEHWEGVES